MESPDASLESAACCFGANRFATISMVAQIVSPHRSPVQDAGISERSPQRRSELLAPLGVRTAWLKGSRFDEATSFAPDLVVAGIHSIAAEICQQL